MEGSEKTGVRDFGFCERREIPVLQGRKRLREEECGSQDQRMALWPILNEIWMSKMEIPEEFQKNSKRLRPGKVVPMYTISQPARQNGNAG